MILGIGFLQSMVRPLQVSVGKTVNMNEYVEMTILVSSDVTFVLRMFLDGEKIEYIEKIKNA
tara:strand:+ start:204 stop:389 length:186 start_codon:yes stop_codon:yes gene_type:complete